MEDIQNSIANACPSLLKMMASMTFYLVIYLNDQNESRRPQSARKMGINIKDELILDLGEMHFALRFHVSIDML